MSNEYNNPDISSSEKDGVVCTTTPEYVKNSIEDHAKSRNHPDATLEDKGFVILSNDVGSNSETMAATPKAVKAAYDLANSANQNANNVNKNANNANDNANTRLAKDQNGADIPDKTAFVTNLGLSELVYRAVGNGPNQVPDMNSFDSRLDESGYQKLPSGLIIQWGTVYGNVPQYTYEGGWVQSSSDIEFPIQFPNKCVSLACSLIYGGTSYEWIAIAQAINPRREGATLLIHTRYMPTQKPAATYIAVGY